MNARRYRYTASLSIGGDTPTWEGEVEFSYEVAWGSPPSGQFGPPEHYDPGSGDEAENLKVEKIDGKASGWSEYQSDAEVGQDMVERLTEADYDAMTQSARESDEADRDAYEESRAEERRLEPEPTYGADDGDDF